MADMVLDFYVIVAFARHKDIVWFSLSLGLALAPYVIAYSSLNSYFVKRGVFKGSKTRQILGFLFMFPTSMIYFFIFDVFFIIQTIINDGVSIIFRQSFIDSEGLVDSIFTKMGLTLMDSKGYRRLRTLSQLSFESIPQIVTLTLQTTETRHFEIICQIHFIQVIHHKR